MVLRLRRLEDCILRMLLSCSLEDQIKVYIPGTNFLLGQLPRRQSPCLFRLSRCLHHEIALMLLPAQRAGLDICLKNDRGRIPGRRIGFE